MHGGGRAGTFNYGDVASPAITLTQHPPPPPQPPADVPHDPVGPRPGTFSLYRFYIRLVMWQKKWLSTGK